MVKIILIVLAALFVLSLLLEYTWYFVAVAVLAIGGYIAHKIHKKKHAEKAASTDKSATNAEQTAAPEEQSTDRITTYEVKGVFNYEKDIFNHLMEENPEYEYSKRDLIDACIVGDPVYKWVPEQLPATLVPEPENPYDPNAIKVMVGDILIGYIPKGKTAEVKNLMDEGRLLNVSYEITGGKYKLVTEDYDPEKDKSTYELEQGYEKVAAKVYVKGRL